MTTTDLNIAKRLAHQLWGDINEYTKVTKGAWWFSCSSHGGYIVDINLHPQFAFKKMEVLKRGYIYASEQHFAALEEDCDFAMFEYMYLASDTNPSTAVLEKILERWNPEWFRAYQSISFYKAHDLMKMICYRDYADPLAVAKGLLAQYELYVGTPIENIPPMVRLKLRDNCFVFGGKGDLKSEPELGYC